VSEDLVSKIEKLFNEMKDWEKKPLAKSGRIVVELVKLPEKRTKTSVKPASLAIMIRREDAFRGLLISSDEELDDLLTITSSERIKEIARAVREVNKKIGFKEFEL
jgi:hypothetical protein